MEPERLAEMGDAARRRVVETATEDIVTARYCGLFAGLQAGCSGSPRMQPDNLRCADRKFQPGSWQMTEDDSQAREILQYGGGQGRVYRFDDLLLDPEPVAPPMIFIHVPKAAGSTLKSVFMKNYKFRADSRGNDFFSRYTPHELINLAGAPRSEDDRVRPAFFAGHINLDNRIFGAMPVRFVAVTLLREPIERVISHYRFNSTQPSAIQDAIRNEGLSVIDYCRKFGHSVTSQYRMFAPDGDIDVALRRLQTEVSFFGLQSQFERSVQALCRLLGLPTTPYKPLNRTPAGAADVTQDEAAELRSLLTDEVAFYDSATEVYRERLTRIGEPLAEHPWTRFYS